MSGTWGGSPKISPCTRLATSFLEARHAFASPCLPLPSLSPLPSPTPSRIVSKKAAAAAAEANGGHEEVDMVGEPYLVAKWDGAHLATSPVASLKRESDGAPIKRPRFDFQLEAEVRGTATSTDAELVIEVRDRSRVVVAADAAAANAVAADAAAADAAAADTSATAAEGEAEGGVVGERVGLVRFTRDDLELRCRHDDTAEPHEISPWQVRTVRVMHGPSAPD